MSEAIPSDFNVGEASRKHLEHVVEAIRGVLGVSLQLLCRGRTVLTSTREPESEVQLPEGIATPVFRLTDRKHGCLFVPVQAVPDSGVWHVVAGPFPEDGTWVCGETVLENAFDSALTIEVPRQALTIAYLSTIFRTLLPFALDNSAKLDRACDDIGIENIRRIGAALAKQFGIIGENGDLTRVARSFSRIRPLREFVKQLSPASSPEHLTRIFHLLTERLPVGFHLVDLLARSLIKPTKYSDVCRNVFRKGTPLTCALSDLENLWAAVIQHRLAESPDEAIRYKCPGCYTEMLCPVFAEDLAVGAIFGGQMVESAAQQDAILSEAKVVTASSTGDDFDWRAFIAVSDAQTATDVGKACVGLASLTGTTFSQWCRAESESGLRSGLIEASQVPTLRGFAAKVCQTILYYLDVTQCSLWLFDEIKLVLLATTAEWFYVREHLTQKPTRKRSDELLGKATYSLGEGLTGSVARDREPLRVPCASKVESWSGKFSEAAPDRDAAFMAFPLIREGRLWGVFRSSKVGIDVTITDTDFRLFGDVANEIAISIREKFLAEQAQAQADRFKFIMKVGAHEFRGPLQIIVSQLGVLTRKVKEEIPDVRDVVKIIEEQAYRAKHQMDNALAFDNPIAYNFQSGSLGLLFRAAELEFYSRAAERNITITIWDSAKRLPRLRMDSERVAQVITNLLDNAVKYSFKGEKIHVRGWEGSESVRFSVENRGIGIPKRFAEVIFEPFQRKVVEDRTRFIAGTGLGLPIVKQIVTAHGGSVTFSSHPFLDDPRKQDPEYGHVVTFTVELPKKERIDVP